MPANLFGTMMKTRAHLLGATLLAFLASLILAAPAEAGTPAPRTISNVATIAWDAGGQHVELPSNRVDIDVVPPPTATAVLETLRLADGLFPPAVLAGTCSAATARRRRTALQGSDRRRFPPSTMIATSEILAGRPIVLALDRPGANRDSQADRDASIVVIETDLGDREEITLVETSADSGRFIGIMLTTTGAAGVRRLPPLGAARTRRWCSRSATTAGGAPVARKRGRHPRRSLRHRLRQPRRHAGLGRSASP